MVANLMERGQLVIPSDPSDPRTVDLAAKLANEMRAFPDGHTGDSLMALWFAISETRELLGTRILVPAKGVDMIKDSPELKTAEQRAPYEAIAEKKMRAEDEWARSQFNKDMLRRMRER